MPLDEARRILEICAICKYCNGYCETLRIAEKRSSFTDGDITYLAHLCHNCANCWPACQYAPPHPFAVNVPRALAEVRELSWKRRSWIAWVFMFLFPALTLALVPWDVLFAKHSGPGAFYKVLPWSVLVSTALIPFLISFVLFAVRLFVFWKRSGGGHPWKAIPSALRDILSLPNLKGGGIGCHDRDDVFSFWRRRFHLVLLYGFLLCVLSTLSASIWHHVFHIEAPYPVFSLPVVLGTVGGVGVMTGCCGLAWIKFRGNAELDSHPKDYTLLLLLFLVCLTGLALLAFRETFLMGFLLSIHMGCVTGFFATLACGKFAHAPFRAMALLRAAMERSRASND